MIERDEAMGEIAVRCDDCTNLSDAYHEDDFNRMIAELKEEGWKVKRDGRAEGGWSHVCPDHTGANRVAEARRRLGL